MQAVHGLRSRTRDLLARGFRNNGTLQLGTRYHVGDNFGIKLAGAVHEARPYNFHHGRTGEVWNLMKRAIGVQVKTENYGSLTESLTSLKNGIPAVDSVRRDYRPALFSGVQPVPPMGSRTYITTMSDAEKPASQDVSASSSATELPPRIKFKRPDKTARHIMQILDKEAVEEVKTQREIPDIRPGYIIQLRLEAPENKRRVSTVKGIVIARRNAGLNSTIRLRRLVAGVGVESLLPLYSPNIKEIKVLDKKKVRRAKLYYLRDKMNALKKQ